MTRALVRHDPFSGEARPRLRHLDRDLDAVITDAQSRDWSADRPDRVVFARLGQTRHQVRSAAGRRGTPRPPADPVAVLTGVTAGCLTAGAVLLAAGAPGVRPLPLALTAVAGLWAALTAVAVLRHLRRRWDRTATAGPAPIDDPYRYAAFRRRIEACAATARHHRSHRHRAAAIDLEYALDWLAAAQSELHRR
ncbi:hypothetical protein QLQ12_31685 [Actinoplanes sp. NEAU-A12]|uniref:SLATT domain-containing protein n=1 Tax=Actinoplanes sandaracinus TaxID=3045177 RepID=A0ABT6WTW3_9ACTN|nr:hypothetical protein [Actinoplanes sandaracinus]MDI6103179.1 hypothetical protein [Actinoplanes sandaracinus]